ncbi:MAG: hypothetical protein KDA58_08135 [Planctomycetaceae bacterium]|nr:hypothetical protein [Planctomycetaceae bacterium]
MAKQKQTKSKSSGDTLRYAGYPRAIAYVNSDGKKRYKELPWGFAVYDTGEREGKYKVKSKVDGKTYEGQYAACHRLRRGSKESTTIWIREHELQDNRCLEIVFVDIGQGDGCFISTPEGKSIVIDAGEEDNMCHYLNWRFGTSKKTKFEAAIISHPDSDHYKGFEALFARPNFYFETVYTNGLMEYADPKKPLGPEKSHKLPDGKKGKLCAGLVTSYDELKTFLADKKNWTTKSGRGKQFASMLNEAFLGNKEIRRWGEDKPEQIPGTGKETMGDYKMLSVDDEYLPGYGPKKPVSMQILGPVTDVVDGRRMLRWLESNISKTKNGHSVVLKLVYGDVSIMLGGDLNIPAEHLLLSHHTGMESPPKPEDKEEFLAAARKVFAVDVAKSCHHGSSDFTPWFLQALNPTATVVSSGDAESFSHPRSDTLGAIGRYSRAEGDARPLIFSTELARSAENSIAKPWELKASLMDKFNAVSERADSREELMSGIKDALKEADIERSVAVFGAITLVTDGDKVVIYQKYEKKSSSGEHDIYCLTRGGDGTGPLEYQPRET